MILFYLSIKPTFIIISIYSVLFCPILNEENGYNSSHVILTSDHSWNSPFLFIRKYRFEVSDHLRKCDRKLDSS